MEYNETAYLSQKDMRSCFEPFEIIDKTGYSDGLWWLQDNSNHLLFPDAGILNTILRKLVI